MMDKICYLELDTLFCEFEWDVNDNLRCINVQLPHPSDPKDTSKWVDLTDNLTELQLQYIAEQMLETFEEDDGREDYLYDLRKDEGL